jgi:hypothetical protein
MNLLAFRTGQIHVANMGILPRTNEPRTAPQECWKSRLADLLAHVNSSGSKSARPVNMMRSLVISGHAQPDLFKSFAGEGGLQSAQRPFAIALALVRGKDMKITDECQTRILIRAVPEVTDKVIVSSRIVGNAEQHVARRVRTVRQILIFAA